MEFKATLRKSGVNQTYGIGIELDVSPASVDVPREVLVESVVVGGIGHAAGIRQGMQVLLVNDIDVTNTPRAKAVVELAMSSSPVELTLLERADAGAGAGAPNDQISAEKLEKMNLLRKHILQEILDNEKKHVRTLEFLVRVFIRRLEKVDPDKVPMYFSNLEQLYNSNKQFLSCLAPEIENNDGKALSKVFMQNIRGFHVYVKYVGELQFILKELEPMMGPKPKSSPALKHIFEEAQEEMHTTQEFKRFELKELLNTPFQTIIRYPMHVERLLEKGMPRNHPDFELLTDCLERLKKLAADVNTNKETYDELYIISLKLKDYTGLPLHLLGDLVHQGNVQARDVLSGMSSRKAAGSKTARVGFLFSDPNHQFMRLILTQPGSLRSDPGATYYYVKDQKVLTKDTQLRRGDMTFVLEAENNFPNAWTVECRRAYFTLSVKTPQERQEWLDVMQRNLDVFNDVRKKLPIRQSSEQISPLSVRDWELNRYDIQYSEKDLIGSGNFGDVMKGIYTIFDEHDNQQYDVAVKQLKPGLKASDFVKEFAVMKAVRHEHILMLHGVCSQQEPFLIVTEYMNRGNLRTFLLESDEAPQMVLNDFIYLSTHIVNGMTYLSELNIVHRDLRAENVLLREEEDSLTVKVGDFGLARMTGKYYGDGDKEFPVKWTAPEAIARGKYTTKSDVWSFGVCLYEILTQGMIPYMGMSNKEVMDKVLNEEYRISCPKGLRFPEINVRKVHDISMRCWATDPDKRPSFSELLVELTKVTATAGVIGSVPWPSLHVLKEFPAGSQVFENVVLSRGSLHMSTSEPQNITITRVNDMQSISSLDWTLREEETLKQLDHKNVVKFLGISSGTYPMYLIEVFSHHVGTLSSFFESFKTENGTNALPVASVVDMTYQIANGMEYLHSQNLYHGGLCSRNIAYGKGGSCRVGNLMFSRVRNHEYTKKFNRWAAPEVLASKKSTLKGDIWSFGIVLFELFSMGKLPYASISDDDIEIAINNGVQPGPRPPRAVLDIYNIMQCCYSPQLSVRPSFTDLKQQLSATSVFNAEAYVVCIQTAWREYQSRKTFIHRVRQVRIWCIVLQLDPTELRSDQLSKIIAKAERDIAEIQQGVWAAVQKPVDLDSVEQAFNATGGDISASIRLLLQSISSRTVSPHPGSPPPVLRGRKPSTLTSIRLERDTYPIMVFTEDTAPIIVKLREFLNDGATAEDTQTVLVDYVELEHFVNADEYHDAIGWSEDGELTKIMAADLVLQLEQFMVQD